MFEVNKVARPAPISRLLAAGVLVAVLDGAFAVALYVYVLRACSAAQLMQSLAGALLGRDAFRGGGATVPLGLALHLAVAYGGTLAMISGGGGARRVDAYPVFRKENNEWHSLASGLSAIPSGRSDRELTAPVFFLSATDDSGRSGESMGQTNTAAAVPPPHVEDEVTKQKDERRRSAFLEDCQFCFADPVEFERALGVVHENN